MGYCENCNRELDARSYSVCTRRGCGGRILVKDSNTGRTRLSRSNVALADGRAASSSRRARSPSPDGYAFLAAASKIPGASRDPYVQVVANLMLAREQQKAMKKAQKGLRGAFGF